MRFKGKNLISDIKKTVFHPPGESKKRKEVDSVARKMPNVIVREARLAFDDPIFRKRGLSVSWGFCYRAGRIHLLYLCLVASVCPVVAEYGFIRKKFTDFLASETPPSV
jgi:hypothetical protein